MRNLIIALLILALPTWVFAGSQQIRQVVTMAKVQSSDPCTGLSQYSICESFNGANDCDGAGALEFTNCTNSTWVTAGDGTINFAKTGINSDETYSLEIEESTTDTSVYIPFTGADVISVYSKIEPTDVAVATNRALLTIGSGAQCVFMLDCDGTTCTVQSQANGVLSANTVGTISQGTTEYHLWLDTSNTDNTCTAAFSTDGTKPTSGDNYTSVTNAYSVNAARLTASSNTTDMQINFWKIRVRTDGTLIGNNPQ